MVEEVEHPQLQSPTRTETRTAIRTTTTRSQILLSIEKERVMTVRMTKQEEDMVVVDDAELARFCQIQ